MNDLAGLPDRLVFVDVETTGLHSADRIVSLAAVEIETASIPTGKFSISCRHLIFDPGKKSHPRAEAVHGYDDWLLRHQEPFSDHAEALLPLFEKPGAVWAHNAPFDQRFISSEFQRVGHSLSASPFSCTMQLYRAHRSGRAGLNAILSEMGLARSSAIHSALEDAWMAMLVWLRLHGWNVTAMPPQSLFRPANLTDPPALIGDLPPRRRRKKKPTVAISHDPIDPTKRFIPAEQAQRIEQAAWPLAVAMLSVARADAKMQESEFAAIEALLSEIGHTFGVKVYGPAEYFDMTANLIEGIEITGENMDRAAELIVADQYCRDNVARWIKEVTYADGGADDAERGAISGLTERLRLAKLKGAQR